MSSMPEEMYHEILVRLPVKSLLICKSVCKSWYALISTSDFVEFHLDFATQKNNPLLMFGSSIRVLKSIDCDSLASSVCEFEDAAIKMDYPFKSLHYSVRLMGSCNGLVCIRLNDYYSGRDFLCLWNPATREYKEIPKSQNKSPNTSPDKTIFSCALVYYHQNDDYKFVIGVETRGTQDSTLVQVYRLASNSWKPWQTVPYWFTNSMQRNGVLFNGDLHWLAVAQDNFFLLSLDISDESYLCLGRRVNRGIKRNLKKNKLYKDEKLVKLYMLFFLVVAMILQL